ncbi:MAG: dihydroorotate dehydrogenase electron transfer subunit [Dehalococcoidia bacterium]|nr:dihydroorotate dehydrogenase electron transfer subunit [Dehalococcoidia bacterium]
MKQIHAPIGSIEEVASGMFVMWLEAPEIAGQAKPGKFVMVRCGEETVLRRPLSIHRVDEDSVALLFMVRGKGTDWLAHREPGETLDIFGPMGNGFCIAPRAKNLLLVAGGIGIAPLYYLAEYAIQRKKHVTLLFGAASADCLYPPDFLPDGMKVAIATEDGSAGNKGLVTELLAEHVVIADQVFACGPLPMYRNMAAHKKTLGIEDKPVQISLEMRMGCGTGVCYSCTIRTKAGLKQVCKDGPVFNLDEVFWDEFTRC